MKWGRLFAAALIIRLTVALLIPEPGYMDAAYYTANGIRLAEGQATEPFVWNYLDAPQTLPVPAFGYWMPLPSLLMAPFWRIAPSFLAAQLPFVILSALWTTLGAYIAWKTTGQRRIAWGVGGLLCFSGYYFPYWTLPETFTPYAFLGTVALWSAGRYAERGGRKWAVFAAAAASLAYLTRADGLLLMAVVLLPPLRRRDGWSVAAMGGAMAAVLAPWIAYNLAVRGRPLPTGGTATLWLTTYDDLFCYRCDLSPRTYWAWGWRAILRSKWDALVWNIQTLLAVLGYVILAPFAVVGGWRLRRQRAFALAWLYLLVLFTAMTLAFTFPGPRGGLFHSGGMLLPFITTAGLVGLDRAVGWLGGKRGWSLPQAKHAFTWGMVGIAVLMSLLLTPPKLQKWQRANAAYRQVGAWLRAAEANPCAVLVGDAPRFWLLNRIPALSIPNEKSTVAAEVARRYGACWLYLDKDHPRPLRPLYESEGDTAWELVHRWREGKLYRLRADKARP